MALSTIRFAATSSVGWVKRRLVQALDFNEEKGQLRSTNDLRSLPAADESGHAQ
jgi:hypothetical protein